MTKRMKYVVSFAASLALAACVAAPALAQSGSLTADDLGVGAVGGELKLGDNDIRGTAGRLIMVALGFLGIISVMVMLMGGFKYMVSGGSTEKTDEARKYIISGIIGLAIILSSWAISTYVITGLLKATASDV
jgi:hypothetical protein